MIGMEDDGLGYFSLFFLVLIFCGACVCGYDA